MIGLLPALVILSTLTATSDDGHHYAPQEAAQSAFQPGPGQFSVIKSETNAKQFAHFAQQRMLAARAGTRFADILQHPLSAVVRIETEAEQADGTKGVVIGSGAIISAPKGYIVTNFHVVAGGQNFRVQLADGRWRNATLVGADAATDLAVLQIAATGLASTSSCGSMGWRDSTARLPA